MQQLLDDLYIFEMANNHQGSLEHGLAIVDACARIARHHQVHAGVKLQLRELDSFIHPDFQARDDVPHIPRFQSTRNRRFWPKDCWDPNPRTYNHWSQSD